MKQHWLYLKYVWRHKRFVYQEGRRLGVRRWVDSDPTGYGDYIRIWHPALRVWRYLYPPRVPRPRPARQIAMRGVLR